MEPPSATQNPAADLRPTSPRKTYLKTLHAYIVDDGIGECGERLVATVSGQFPDAEIVMHICAHVRDVDMVKPVVKEASSAQGIIAHTIVEQELKAYLEQLAAEYQVCVPQRDRTDTAKTTHASVATPQAKCLDM